MTENERQELKYRMMKIDDQIDDLLIERKKIDLLLRDSSMAEMAEFEGGDL